MFNSPHYTIGFIVVLVIFLLISGKFNNNQSILGDTEALSTISFTVSKTPTPENYPTPTIDPDPQVNCTNPNCGNRLMKNSECKVITCCRVEDYKYEYVANGAECEKRMKDYYDLKMKEINDEYEKNRQEIINRYSQTAPLPTTPIYSPSTIDYDNEAQSERIRKQNYDLCIQQARNQSASEFNKCASGGAGDSFGVGGCNSQGAVNQLNYQFGICQQLYGN